MRTSVLSDALDSIHPSFIEQAATRRPFVHRRRWMAGAACAAALAVTLLALLLLPGTEPAPPVAHWNGEHHPFGLSDGTNPTTTVIQSSVLAFSWEHTVLTGTFIDYEASVVVEADKVGELLETATVRGVYWNYLLGAAEQELTLPVEIHALQGVSTQAAVAARYLEAGGSQTTEHWYVFCNPCFTPAETNAFFADLGGADNLSVITAARLFVPTPSGAAMEQRVMSDEGKATLCARLADLRGTAELLPEDTDLSALLTDCTAVAQITLRLPTTCRLSAAVFVLDNGQLLLRWDGIYRFTLSPEETAALLAPVEAGTVPSTATSADGTVIVTTQNH